MNCGRYQDKSARLSGEKHATCLTIACFLYYRTESITDKAADKNTDGTPIGRVKRLYGEELKS